MINLLCAFVTLNPLVRFPGRNLPEAILFSRFLEIKKISATFVRSGASQLELDAGPDQVKRVLRSFGAEFHIYFSDGFPSEMQKMTEDWFVINAQQVPATVSMNSFSPDSLIRKAFDQLVARGRIKAGESFAGCKYIVRPWITSSLLRCETASGTMTLSLGGVTREQAFLYDPD